MSDAGLVVSPTTGRGGPQDEVLVGVTGVGEAVTVEDEVAQVGVTDRLGPEFGVVDVPVGPPAAELGADDAHLADEGGELGVGGFVGGLAAQQRDVRARDGLPVP